MLQVLQLHDPVLDERVDLPDSDHVGEHVTQPLRVQEVQVSEGGVIIMQEDAVIVEEGCSLVKLSIIPEPTVVLVLHVPSHQMLKLLLPQHWVSTHPTQLNNQVPNHLFQMQVGGRNLLLQKTLLASLTEQKSQTLN